MKAPWWHRLVITLPMYFVGLILPALLSSYYPINRIGVMVTSMAFLMGGWLLATGLYYPQLARLSPMFVLDQPPERLVWTRKIMIAAGVIALLAGVYGLYALLSGVGAPYE
jgi:hypothetical protein